jgi:DNA-binding GntR family transcriptional regulator
MAPAHKCFCVVTSSRVLVAMLDAFLRESLEPIAVLRRQVYDELKKLILSGALRPGERLHERDLTKQLGVSRTPLREALNQLASDGLVVNRPQRGHFVQAYDAKTVDDLYGLRALLEGHAIELAMERIKAEDKKEFAKLKTLLKRYNGRKEQSSDEIRDSFLVHDLIARVARDQFLHETLTRLYERLQLFVWLDAIYEDDVSLTRKEHFELIDLILSGDKRRAIKHVEEHVRRSHDNVRRALLKRPSLAGMPHWAAQ